MNANNLGKHREIIMFAYSKCLAECKDGKLIYPSTSIAAEPMVGDTIRLVNSRELLLVQKRHHYEYSGTSGRMLLSCEVVDILDELPKQHNAYPVNKSSRSTIPAGKATIQIA